MVSEGFIPCFAGAIFFLFGYKKWEHLFFFTLMIAPLGLSLSIFLPKSPQYLFDKGKETEAKEVLRNIANFNGYNLPKNYSIIKEEDDSDQPLSEGKLKYFSSLNNIKKLGIFTIILSYVCFNGVLFDYYLKYIEVNMFFINVLKSVGGAIAIIISYTLLRFFDFKKVAITILVGLLALSIPLLGDLQGDKNTMIIISLVGISAGMTSLIVLMYFFVSETFPHAVVPLVLTLAHLSSNILMILSPEFAELKGKTPIFVYI